jgi:hypothetical protein
MARLFAERFTDKWGQTVKVTNTGSENAAASVYAIKEGAPDGYLVNIHQTNLPIRMVNGQLDFGSTTSRCRIASALFRLHRRHERVLRL